MVGEQFFEWLENSWDFEKVWERGIKEYNKSMGNEGGEVVFNLDYQQFKIMCINRLDELIQGAPWTPSIGSITIDPEDRMKST